MPFFDLSDEAYLERQRRFSAIRRPAGGVLLLLGCGIGAFGVWVWFNNNPRQVVAGNPVGEVAYHVGLMVGTVFGAGALTIIQTIVHGLGLLMGGRSTRLLLEYNQRLNRP